MSEWRRIVIDSRFRTSDSTSNSDFYVELPYNVTVENISLAYVDAVCMSHSWLTIQENINDKIYCQELPAGISGATIDRAITLSPGTYNSETLQAELQAKLRLGTSIGSGQYIVAETHGISRLDIHRRKHLGWHSFIPKRALMSRLRISRRSI